MRFTCLALLVSALAVSAAPVPEKRAFSFALQSYSQFQISDGVAGNAQAEAEAVFVTPFPTDLTTVDATSLDNLGTMREAAENAETSLFNPQIAAASGAQAAALQVGKIKNKVLKLTGEVQQIKIKIAQAAAAGSDTSDLESSLTEEQTKLNNNIALDVKSKGQASQGVA
ncbi:NAD(P)-binding protein [Mycena venus]|uniref:NAD(P)-binding protein n=1 Tax=Mycena venus TaxID=2733690 RepID=A0A8H6XIM1_9AGAR|nr:NAD(P)-binding protein [Mycena venus]